MGVAKGKLVLGGVASQPALIGVSQSASQPRHKLAPCRQWHRRGNGGQGNLLVRHSID
ncbi:MAG: hypothetical protein MJE68_07430 [Proteobacteria bacterium]|nr:hypothetical protein [Pseudomonadota bacterium]